MAAVGRAAAGPLLRPGPSLTSAAGRGTAGASGRGITSRPSAVSTCHPAGLFRAGLLPIPGEMSAVAPHEAACLPL